MASSSKAPCATCGNKAAGIFRCEGCIQVFCRKHLNEHRDLLSHQFDEIVMAHDTLQQTVLENKTKKNDQHPILKQIDQWESDSIMKIRQMAHEAREKVDQLNSSDAGKTVSKELHELAERLQKARADDGYVETDLRTWVDTLEKLRKAINSYSPSISIQEDRSQILIGRMFVSTAASKTWKAATKAVEIFGLCTGPIHISENGLLATHIGSINRHGLVRGSCDYSSGKHSIRFVFIKKNTKFATLFYIVSKLNLIGGQTNEFGSHGWSSDDHVYCNHSLQVPDQKIRDMQGQTTFEIELQLDCDNQMISYVNQRTKTKRQLAVDTKKCPFPWQVEFYLFEVGDCVQLLT